MAEGAGVDGITTGDVVGGTTVGYGVSNLVSTDSEGAGVGVIKHW